MKYVKGIEENVNLTSNLKSSNIDKALTYGEKTDASEIETVDFDEYGIEPESSTPETEPEIEAIDEYETESEINTNSLNYQNIRDDGFTVQGYTIVTDENGNNKIMITAYSKDGEKSRIYVYDQETGELDGKIILDNTDHVGGISYDIENGVVYVAASDGKVHAYDYEKMITILNDSKKVDGVKTFDMNDQYYIDNYGDEGVEIPNDIDVLDVLNGTPDLDNPNHYQSGMDSVYYYDGCLYSTTFSDDGELICSKIVYNRDENGNITGISVEDTYEVGKLDGAVQGICFYKEDGKTYMISSSSAKGSAKSRLTKWEVTDDGIVPIAYKYINHPGLEGIDVQDGRISGVFEYNEQETEELGTDDFKEGKSIPDMMSDFWYSFSGDDWDRKNN